jgi:6-phosphogluconolactonase (cycloisomerase 2 family)
MRGSQAFRLSLLVAVLATSLTASAGAARAATGDLTYRDCIGADNLVPDCIEAAGFNAGADNGLDGASFMAISPDGLWVYATAATDDSVARFARDPATGALSDAGCLAADSAASVCSLIPGAVAGGANTGLDDPEELVVSPDGTSLYVASDGDSAIAIFSRDPATGAIAFAGCISGEQEAAGCDQLPGATSGGGNSGLQSPESLAISPDGGFLYALATGDEGVATFARGAGGELTFLGCVTGNSSLTSCTHLAGATPTAENSGFNSLRALGLTRDGRSLYTVDDADEAIAHFERDASSGALAYQGCLSVASDVACADVPGATPQGLGTGMRSLVHVATSPDLSSVYASGDSEDSIIHYRRSPDTGTLTFAGCLTGTDTPASAQLCSPIPGAGTHDGMSFTRWAVVGADARSVDVLGASDDAITHFVRDPLTGALTHAGCLSAETESTVCAQLPIAESAGANSGFDNPVALAGSADGRSLYGSSFPNDGLAIFDREPDLAGPALQLSAKKKQTARAALRAKGGKVKATATCTDELCAKLSLTGKLKVKLDGKRRRAGYKPQGAGNVQPGEPLALKLKPKRKAKKLLKRAGRGTVQLTATATDLLGNESVAKRRVKLKRR